MPRQKSTHVDDPVAVGRRLREARLEKGLSQRQLSFPGCTAAYISRIEAGDRIPSLQLLRELGRRLDVSAEYLATGTSGRGEDDKLLEAELALRLEELELAEHLFGEALAAASSNRERGRALCGLGQLAFHAGELELAIERLEQAEELLGEAVLDYPALLETLGKAYAIRGELESAIGALERAVKLSESRADAVSRARFSVLLANAEIDIGDFGRAEQLLGHAIAESRQLQDPVFQARLAWSQSRLHAAQGQFDLAADYARRALGALDVVDNAAYVARAHHLLAFVELERGNPARALELLHEAHPTVRRSGDRFLETQFRLEEARALHQLGESEQARELALEALPELERMSRIDSARCYALLAATLAETGERAQAIELYQIALEKLGDCPNAYAVDIHRRLAELLEAEGRIDEAFDLLKRAVSLQGGHAAGSGSTRPGETASR